MNTAKQAKLERRMKIGGNPRKYKNKNNNFDLNSFRKYWEMSIGFMAHLMAKMGRR